MAAASLAGADGGFAAAGEKAPVATAGTTGKVSLAGRWKGPRYGYSFRGRGAEACAGKRCELTYDIVACGEAWCGIAVADDATCGAVALRMTVDTKPGRGHVFDGKLELAKGAAPYTVQAWYAAPEADDGTAGQRTTATLSFIGDTGSELLMMRRSFPFQAELQRITDAACTLEKTTS